MKICIKVIGIACLSASLISCGNKDNVKLETLEDSANFCLGFQTAAMWAQRGVDSINNDAFVAGFNAFNIDEQNLPLELEQEQYSDLMQRYAEILEQRELTKMKTEFAPNIEAGEKFLAENKEKAGVITTASGLQYEIISEGKGVKPSLYDTISVIYKGTFIDGTVFDSTMEPIKLPLIPNGLIQGWIEALPLFAEGTKAKLYIPYDLAYGEYGNQGVQPFSTLIFDIELVKVIKGKAPETSDMMSKFQK
ncbi:MAG: FKBP-type peptidyl-prolyl cis-trans isomerase [Bacteroidales bacterium]|nr:FKBP-type peptidyl-prolyl cis-trans isomerase [Bacteroidales bacterium]MBP5724475.1 FKBP-type peptidyl-prolyl cis-trans isomerase [Bacteroidales bacterium]MBQ3677244.1 FKBP-type peptidyl-prolyl cis-trans isomerase [Bacteroidales bacterium]MBQ4215799.1 FKBP-type peptidyl-prolyl cis-trans isomerase [Bacteroidales bacterium]MBR4498730.1 FKBP-type peptidyl-prolyl cis-trans isomerase [Bacteroidales bacterium]